VQTLGSLFNWCTPDVISKWEWNKVKASRFILIEVFFLWMEQFNKSGDLMTNCTWGSIAQKDGVEFLRKRVKVSPIFLFSTMDLRSALNVRLLPEYA